MATVSGTTQPIDKTYVRNQPYLSCLGVDELIYPPFYAASLKYNSKKTRRNLAHDMIEISRVCFTTLHQYLSSLLSMKTVQDTLWWSVIRIISKMSSIRLIQSLAKRGSVASSKDKGWVFWNFSYTTSRLNWSIRTHLASAYCIRPRVEGYLIGAGERIIMGIWVCSDLNRLWEKKGGHRNAKKLLQPHSRRDFKSCRGYPLIIHVYPMLILSGLGRTRIFE